MKKIIEVSNLTKKYSGQKSEVLKGISLSIMEQDFVAIMGRSGCGKTTFLKILGMIEQPSTGTLLFKDKVMGELWEDEIADIRRCNMGFIFQDYNLMDSLSLEENILLPAILDKADMKEKTIKARKLAAQFEIDELLSKYPYQLSGGEKQRVALCRALINEPEIIFGDEPTGNLDSVTGEEVISSLEMFNTNLQKTVVIVTHDPKIASRCKKVILMKDGLLLKELIKEDDKKDDFYAKIILETAQL